MSAEPKPMGEEAQERLRAAMDSHDDWRGRCSVCGVNLVGTPTELKAHQCERGAS